MSAHLRFANLYPLLHVLTGSNQCHQQYTHRHTSYELIHGQVKLPLFRALAVPFICPCPCILPCYLPLFCHVPSLLQPIMPSVLFSEEAQISRAIRCGPRLCTRKRLAMSSIVIGLILFTLGMFALLYIPIALKDGVTSNMIVDSSSAPLYASPPAFFLCSIH